MAAVRTAVQLEGEDVQQSRKVLRRTEHGLYERAWVAAHKIPGLEVRGLVYTPESAKMEFELPASAEWDLLCATSCEKLDSSETVLWMAPLGYTKCCKYVYYGHLEKHPDVSVWNHVHMRELSVLIRATGASVVLQLNVQGTMLDGEALIAATLTSPLTGETKVSMLIQQDEIVKVSDVCYRAKAEMVSKGISKFNKITLLGNDGKLLEASTLVWSRNWLAVWKGKDKKRIAQTGPKQVQLTLDAFWG